MARFYPTDAGQALFGPIVQGLQYLGEQKASANVRAEQRRRYDERMRMERERIAREQAATVYGAQAQLAGMPAERGLEAVPALREFLRTTGPGGEAAAALYAPPTMRPATPEEYRPISGPTPLVEEQPAGSAWEAIQSRAETERSAAAETKRRATGRAAFGPLLKTLKDDPTGEGQAAAYQALVEGAVPPSQEQIQAAAARAAQARLAVDLAKARAKGRGRGQPREPSRIPAHLKKDLVQSANFQEWAAEAKAGTIYKGLKGAPMERIKTAWVLELEKNTSEAMNRSARYAKDQHIRTLRGDVAAAAAAARKQWWAEGAQATLAEANQALREATEFEDHRRIEGYPPPPAQIEQEDLGGFDEPTQGAPAPAAETVKESGVLGAAGRHAPAPTKKLPPDMYRMLVGIPPGDRRRAWAKRLRDEGGFIIPAGME